MPVPRACVSLTYDDALPVHHETVAPLLEAHGLRATFYVPCGPRFLAEAEHWRRIAGAGHELGNHTIFHPCRNARTWLDPVYDMAGYTARRWNDEVALANGILRLIDGRDARSYGNTCHENIIGAPEAGATVEALAPEHFVAARGEHTGRPARLSPTPRWFNLGNRGIDGRSFDELKPELEALERDGGWFIYTLHSVGPRDHSLHMTEPEHLRLVEWLSPRRDTILTAPVRDVAAHLRATATLPNA